MPLPGRNDEPQVQPEGVAVPGSTDPEKSEQEAKAVRLDLEPAEERVEYPRPIIMYGPDPLEVGTDPASFGNFLDLVEQDRILQCAHDRLRIFE